MEGPAWDVSRWVWPPRSIFLDAAKGNTEKADNIGAEIITNTILEVPY